MLHEENWNQYEIVQGRLAVQVMCAWGEKSVAARAIIDTGAMRSCVTARLLDELKAPEVGEVDLATIRDTDVATTHRLQIGLMRGREMRNFQAIRVPSIVTGTEVILGCDFLSTKRLTVDCAEGVFMLEATSKAAERNHLRRANRKLVSGWNARIRKTCIRKDGRVWDDPALGRFYAEEVETGEVLAEHVDLNFMERMNKKLAEAAE